MWKGWSAGNSDEIDADASSGVQFKSASRSDVLETGRKRVGVGELAAGSRSY